MTTEHVLAALNAAQLVVILALIWAGHRARVDHGRAIDRLLLLGKSSSPGEAIAAYERMNRVERARDEVMAQRALGAGRVRGADQGSAESVAPKASRGTNWFGFRKPRPAPSTGG